MLNDKI